MLKGTSASRQWIPSAVSVWDGACAFCNAKAAAIMGSPGSAAIRMGIVFLFLCSASFGAAGSNDVLVHIVCSGLVPFDGPGDSDTGSRLSRTPLSVTIYEEEGIGQAGFYPAILVSTDRPYRTARISPVIEILEENRSPNGIHEAGPMWGPATPPGGAAMLAEVGCMGSPGQGEKTAHFSKYLPTEDTLRICRCCAALAAGRGELAREDDSPLIIRLDSDQEGASLAEEERRKNGCREILLDQAGDIVSVAHALLGKEREIPYEYNGYLYLNNESSSLEWAFGSEGYAELERLRKQEEEARASGDGPEPRIVLGPTEANKGFAEDMLAFARRRYHIPAYTTEFHFFLGTHRFLDRDGAEFAALIVTPNATNEEIDSAVAEVERMFAVKDSDYTIDANVVNAVYDQEHHAFYFATTEPRVVAHEVIHALLVTNGHAGPAGAKGLAGQVEEAYAALLAQRFLEEYLSAKGMTIMQGEPAPSPGDVVEGLPPSAAARVLSIVGANRRSIEEVLRDAQNHLDEIIGGRYGNAQH